MSFFRRKRVLQSCSPSHHPPIFGGETSKEDTLSPPEVVLSDGGRPREEINQGGGHHNGHSRVVSIQEEEICHQDDEIEQPLQSETFGSLPVELLERLLSCLSKCHLLALRGTCRAWRRIVQTHRPVECGLWNRQSELYLALRAGRHVLLTGPAGCGKTSTLRCMLTDLLQGKRLWHPSQVRVLCPTHRSRELVSELGPQLGVSVSTVHSFLGLNRTPSLLRVQEMIDRQRASGMPSYRFSSELRLLIIDEISMVGERLLDCMDMMLRAFFPLRQNSHLPMCGIQVLMSGDFGQLRPVGDRWAFQGALWQRMQVHVIELDVPLRQSEDLSWFAILQSIRLGTQRRLPPELRDRVIADESSLSGCEKMGHRHLRYYSGFLRAARQHHLDNESCFLLLLSSSSSSASSSSSSSSTSTSSSSSPNLEIHDSLEDSIFLQAADVVDDLDDDEQTSNSMMAMAIHALTPSVWMTPEQRQQYGGALRPIAGNPFYRYCLSLRKTLQHPWPLELSSDNDMVEEMNARMLKSNPFPVDRLVAANDVVYREMTHPDGRRYIRRYPLDAVPLAHRAKLDSIWRFPRVLPLKVGGRYVLTQNINPTRGMWNGALVVYVGNGWFVDRSARHCYGQHTLMSSTRILLGDHLWLKRRQLALRPAYALTIHASQGMTVDEAIINTKQLRTHGQLYVALSRVRTRQGVHLINANLDKEFPFDRCVSDFYLIDCPLARANHPPLPLPPEPPSSSSSSSSSSSEHISMKALLDALLWEELDRETQNSPTVTRQRDGEDGRTFDDYNEEVTFSDDELGFS